MRQRLCATGAILPTKSTLVLDAARLICDLGALEARSVPTDIAGLLTQADEVVLNKRDLVARREIERLTAILCEVRGAGVPIVEAKFGRIQTAMRSGRWAVASSAVENRV
jgi:G3E family GTPase